MKAKTQWKLRLFWLDGSQSGTIAYPSRRAAERRAKEYREVALIDRVEIVPYNKALIECA